MAYTSRLKRLLLGRALPTEQRGAQAGPFRTVSSLASDALSSNVYATQEILLVLAIGGFGLYRYGPVIALCVVITFAIVVAAYRHTVAQYTSGGADYDVAAANLGRRAAVTVAAAMLVDFALTLAVSVAATLETLVSLAPGVDRSRVGAAVLLVAVAALLSLRSSAAVRNLLLIGTYSFVAAIVILVVAAVVEVLTGETPRAASADYRLAESADAAAGLAVLVIVTRAFSSGSIAVTGVESVGTGVQDFPEPKGPHTARGLVILGLVSMALFAAITWLAYITDVRVAADADDLIGLPAGQPQQTLLVQVADAVFHSHAAVLAVGVCTMLILLAAGMSSFRSFSALSSILSRDGFLPRQFQSRGDRLVYSNGILLLAVAAGLLLWGFDASLTSLIQLYVVGVFLALTLGQAGMVRHWTRRLRAELPRAQQAAARRARAIALLAQTVTGFVLAVVLISKFTSGAWVVAILIPLLAAAMLAVGRHYEAVAVQMAAEDSTDQTPTHDVIALILVSRIHQPTLRAVAFARATRPTTLEVLTVAVDTQEAQQLAAEWVDRGIPVPLRVLESPFREINTPVITHVQQLRRTNPDALLTIYLPEYVVDRWWQHLLHNRSAARLKRRLMALDNVVVVSVPWQFSNRPPAAAPPTADRAGPA